MLDLDASQFGGLKPRAWICVGSGFSREEVKTELLKRGIGLTQDAVQGLANLCEKVLVASGRAAPGEFAWLGPHAREEGLRSLLAEHRIGGGMPELRRLKRQRSFFKKLDRALQAGRKVAAHEEEAAVLDARLLERLGANPVRRELQALAHAYEAWLGGMSAWDEPLALRTAVEVLREGFPQGLRLPSRIYRMTAMRAEGLEQEFWDLLGRQVECVTHDFFPTQSAESTWIWDRWHTTDDAADALASELVPLFSDPSGIDPSGIQNVAVLIPDQPALRRSLNRALADRGIPLADPRDPTALRTSERVKAAILPLELVARGFEREQVIAWLDPKDPKWLQEIASRGIRNRLSSYAGGLLEPLHARLKELDTRLGGRKTLAELKAAHLALIRESETKADGAVSQGAVSQGAVSQGAGLSSFFEAVWDDFQIDLDRIAQGQRRAPLLYWLERLQARLEDATPPAEKLRPSRGVALYRLSQAPLIRPDHLYLLGLPAEWLDGDGAGDAWYSEAEREVLSAEFTIRSRHQVREERLSILKAWITRSANVTLLDAAYDWDGSERGSLVPTLRLLGAPEDLTSDDGGPQERGAHERWVPSFGAVPATPALPIVLPMREADLAEHSINGKFRIRATDLDRYSKCAFTAMGFSRWRLSDSRTPEADLWPDVKGRILHAAVRILLESRSEDGSYSQTVEQALEQAWREERPKGLLRGGRLEEYAKRKLLPILIQFLVKEREYFERSGARVLSLEGPGLQLEYPTYVIQGRPDRIDVHPEGVFVIDYKSSSSQPNGRSMLEEGSSLQLPFYALAASQHFEKNPLGVQFVELTKKGARSAGLFFKKWNGKEPGKLTRTTEKSKSLLNLEPEDVWPQIEEQIVRHAESYRAGKFEARPKNPKDCERCRLNDVCGWRRRSAAGMVAGTGDGTTASESGDGTAPGESVDPASGGA